MRDHEMEALDEEAVLKILFEGMGRLANIMPEEVGYIFLPRLKEKMLIENKDFYKNVRV